MAAVAPLKRSGRGLALFGSGDAVPVALGGTGANTAAQAATALGLGTGDSPTHAGLTVTGTASATTVNAGTFQLSGFNALQRMGSGYTALIMGDIQVLTASHNGSDGNTYFSNVGFIWRNAAYTTQYATLGANAFTSNVPFICGSSLQLASRTVGTLPTPGVVGRQFWASNGRALNGAGALEAAGAGTGVAVSDNGTAWKIIGTNVTVQA